ncbi:MAG: alpha-ribazole phosphatase [Clostridium sp.]
MKVYIVRHGETALNKRGSYYGDLDLPLTELGIRQGKELSRFLGSLNYKKIFVSEKKRAQDTAKLICSNQEYFHVDNRLNERNFGCFEGLTYKEVQYEHPIEYDLWINDWIHYYPKNGESYFTMCNRVFHFMEELLAEKNQEDVLLVTHSGVMRAIYCYVMNKNIELFWKFSCENCDVAILKYEYGNLFIDSIQHCNLNYNV